MKNLATLTLNLATLFSDTFENITIRFLVLENMSVQIFSFLVLTDLKKSCENEEIWQP